MSDFKELSIEGRVVTPSDSDWDEARAAWNLMADQRPAAVALVESGEDIAAVASFAAAHDLRVAGQGTGHGAAAALLTTLAKLLFHHGSVEHAQPAKIMEAVNDDFRSIFGARSFMTAMCVALDPESGRASIVGAGHPPLLVARRGAAAELVQSSAPPLGLLEHSQFTETAIELRPGDGFLLYTDGLYGPSKGESERWTPARLRALIAGDEANAQALLSRTMERAAPESGGSLADDLAAVAVLRRAGGGF